MQYKTCGEAPELDLRPQPEGCGSIVIHKPVKLALHLGQVCFVGRQPEGQRLDERISLEDSAVS